nr:13730_t:CDS:2 [Entrophospora candida]
MNLNLTLLFLMFMFVVAVFTAEVAEDIEDESLSKRDPEAYYKKYYPKYYKHKYYKYN